MKITLDNRAVYFNEEDKGLVNAMFTGRAFRRSPAPRGRFDPIGCGRCALFGHAGYCPVDTPFGCMGPFAELFPEDPL